MDVTAMLPGNRSPAARARRRAKAAAHAARHPRAARRGMTAVLTGKAAKPAARRPGAVARGARALPLAAMAETAREIAGGERRRRRSKRRVAAVGVAGAGAAAAYIVSRRSGENGHAPATTGESPQVHTTPQEGHPAGTGTRSDRDIGGPTGPSSGAEGATGGAPGTPPDSGFEPHS